MNASRSLSECDPLLAEKVLLVQEEYARRFAPWTLLITFTWRSVAVQAALYAQGRQQLHVVNELRIRVGLAPLTEKQNRKPVTNCDGVKRPSKHNHVNADGKPASLAVDVAPSLDPDGPGPMKAVVEWDDLGRYRPLIELASRVGLVSGGTWRNPQDWPHLELPEAA